MRKKKMTDIDRIEWMDKYEGLLTIDQFADELKTSPRNIRKLRKESSQICWNCKNACNSHNCDWVRTLKYPSYVTVSDGYIVGCDRYES